MQYLLEDWHQNKVQYFFRILLQLYINNYKLRTVSKSSSIFWSGIVLSGKILIIIFFKAGSP